jgi:hypothetical protein
MLIDNIFKNKLFSSCVNTENITKLCEDVQKILIK